MPTRSISASSPTRPATAWRMPATNSGQRFVARRQRHGGRRRLRAGARRRSHHAGRRRRLRGGAAGSAAAGGAAGHRRADPRDRQAQGAPRSRRLSSAPPRKASRASARSMAAGRRDRAQLQARRARSPSARGNSPATRRDGDGQGIALTPLDAHASTTSGIRLLAWSASTIDRAARHRDHHPARPGDAAAGRVDGDDRAGRRVLAAAGWRANSTTPSCICASTNSRWRRCWCSSRRAMPQAVLAYDAFLDANKAHWLANEIRLYWKRVLKRIDSPRARWSTLVEPGSCFAGTLAELVFAADRSYMLIGQKRGRQPRRRRRSTLTRDEFRALSDGNGLTRLQTRFLGRADDARARARSASARRSMPRRPSSSALSPSRSTISTGTTRSGCSWRSAPAFRPTR